MIRKEFIAAAFLSGLSIGAAQRAYAQTQQVSQQDLDYFSAASAAFCGDRAVRGQLPVDPVTMIEQGSTLAAMAARPEDLPKETGHLSADARQFEQALQHKRASYDACVASLKSYASSLLSFGLSSQNRKVKPAEYAAAITQRYCAGYAIGTTPIPGDEAISIASDLSIVSAGSDMALHTALAEGATRFILPLVPGGSNNTRYAACYDTVKRGLRGMGVLIP